MLAIQFQSSSHAQILPSSSNVNQVLLQNEAKEQHNQSHNVLYTNDELNKLLVRFSQHRLTKNQQNLVYFDTNTSGYYHNHTIFQKFINANKPKLHYFDVNVTIHAEAAKVSIYMCLTQFYALFIHSKQNI